MKISVFRFGHRRERDKRITTHCALVSRTFGADKMYYCEDEDDHLEESVKEIVEDWGGNFSVEFVKDWKKFLQEKRKTHFLVHLTMYGTNFEDFAKAFKKKPQKKDLLIIIGSQKVPTEIYQWADVNISVANQPHSEVSALALLLYNLKDYKKIKFPKAKIVVKPNPRGKTAIRQ